MQEYVNKIDTGVECLREVPAHWKIKRLKYLATLNPSKSFLDKESEELVTFLPMENVSDKGQIDSSKKRQICDVYSGFTCFSKGDVILAKITPCFENGKGALLDNMDTEIGFGSTEFHVLRAREDISDKFLFYITKSHSFMELGEAFMTGAAGQKRVPTDFIANYLVASPPLKEQQLITDYLDKKIFEIDSLIACKEQLLKLYAEEKIAITNDAVSKGLKKNTKLINSGIEWLGEIPETWKTIKARYLFKIKKRIAGELGFDVLSITQKGIKVKNLERNDGQVASDYRKYQLVEVGDFAMNHMDLLTGYIDIAYRRGVTSPDYRVFAPINDEIVSEYYLLLFQLGYVRKILYAFGRGAALFGRWRLPADEFNELKFPLPPIDEQREIVNFVKSERQRIDDKIENTKQIIKLQKEYRTALISEAITGQFKVPELVEKEFS